MEEDEKFAKIPGETPKSGSVVPPLNKYDKALETTRKATTDTLAPMSTGRVARPGASTG